MSLRQQSAKLMVILIGESIKYLITFVKWEMEQGTGLGIPLIAINIRGGFNYLKINSFQYKFARLRG